MGHLELLLLGMNLDQAAEAARTCKRMAPVARMFHASTSLFLTQPRFGTYGFII